MDELILIEKAQHGNMSAMNTLLENNYPLLKGYIIKLTGNPELSKDIIQEAMLKAVINIKKYKPIAKFSTWLIRIASNAYYDYLRKNKDYELIDETLEATGNNPEEITLTNIEYREVMSILMGLPYEKRSVFILKHYLNYKYEEIAHILNCPVGTVRSRLHNTIKYIIEELKRKELV